MNILIIGANGGIGKKTVETALAAGHRVTAMVRNPASLSIVHPELKIVKGDIRQPETFEGFLDGQDVVISAIGEKNREPTTLYSEGNRNLLQAMEKKGLKRAFFISASAIEISPVQPFFIRLATKYIVQKLFGNGYADQRVMEKLIKESNIDYTIMRPPRLTDKPATGRYRFAINTFLKNCLMISRADVAHFMINNISNEATYKTTVEIAY
ncbi:MAG TPA: SDR family oxidoreductase [Mucilaginibacter sp.]|jgi:putative NADH-flavin reductase|nr:SDR family oxidoreductase [Mucilaginibacter sp.]